jgi:hypothetical protein
MVEIFVLKMRKKTFFAECCQGQEGRRKVPVLNFVGYEKAGLGFRNGISSGGVRSVKNIPT